MSKFPLNVRHESKEFLLMMRFFVEMSERGILGVSDGFTGEKSVDV